MKIEKNSNISFIMPAFNCENTIEESIDSIFDGNFSDGDELIIINDASTDNTLNTIILLQKKYPVIKLLSHEKNKGSAASGRNTGIENSKNNIIFCLDADNILISKSIPLLKKYMQEKKADIVTFGELHYFKDKNKTVTHKWVYKDSVGLNDALAGDYWPGPSGNYMFTKDSWIKAGKYTESVGGAYDSWAFGIKQLATGSKMITMKNTYYLHRYGYNSTFIRDNSKINPSLIGLSILKDYFNIIEENDINYITNEKNKYCWLENLEKRPLKLKNYEIGINGKMISYHKKDSSNFCRKTYTVFKNIIFLNITFFKKAIFKTVNFIKVNFKKKEPTETDIELIQWAHDDGNKTLRLDYPFLKKDSVVIDVGGFEGQWASDIFSKYCCNIIIFEPVKIFADKIKKRFSNNEKIICYNFGLSNENKDENIALLNDSSSLFKENSNYEKIKLVNATNFFEEEKIINIDLIKINIEGGEYDLLENLLKNNFVPKIKNIQVQFHNFFPDAEKRMDTIHKRLSETHHLTYKYKFVWENWEINEK